MAKEITKSGRHEIASVYVRNPEKRAAFAKQYSALAAKTPEEAISTPNVDAVYIVTPHTTHCVPMQTPAVQPINGCSAGVCCYAVPDGQMLQSVKR